MSLRRVNSETPLDEILAVLEDDGGLIIEGLYPTKLIDSVRDSLIVASDNFEPGAATQGLGPRGNAFVGKNTIRFSSLGKITSDFFQMLDNEVFGALADELLLPNCGSYWVNTAQAMFIGPNSDAQPLHRDCMNWAQMVRPSWPHGPELTLSSMIALEAITEEIGATRVIPGSHRWDELEKGVHADLTVPAEMGPGDALVYTGKLVHGGGANLTDDRWRRAMHLSFVLGWLTPEESSPIDYTDEELLGQSERVQRVLGHRSYLSDSPSAGGLWLRNVEDI